MKLLVCESKIVQIYRIEPRNVYFCV